MPSSDPARSEYAWIGVLALTLTAFIFNTTEFVPVALLSAIGKSFSMPETDVGLMLTIYAWTVSLVSLPLTILTRQVERRKLLVYVLVLFIASHVLTCVAWSFPVLMLGRLGIAGAHAIFWSISVALVVRLAPAEKKGKALGMLATGSAVAMVAGIPLGRVIGEHLGWRDTFGVIAASATVALVILRLALPPLPSHQAGSLKHLPVLLRKPVLAPLYLVTIFVVAAHFTSYTYIEPFLRQAAHASDGRITYCLIVFGAAGIPAAIGFNRYFAAAPERFLLRAVIVLSVCLLVVFPFSLNIVTLSLHVLVWGGSIVCFGLAMQAWILRLAPEATDMAVSIFSGLYNVAIGAGALLGNHVANSLGVPWTGTFGGMIGGVGALFCWWALRRRGEPVAA
ncbi:MAG: Sugar efflux transporter B [Burkholderia plantarii]|nr:MAG: Sugar efflux transporter B [Burkholderia plantarii]